MKTNEIKIEKITPAHSGKSPTNKSNSVIATAIRTNSVPYISRAVKNMRSFRFVSDAIVY